MRAILNREAVVRLRVDDEGGTLIAADSTPTVVVTDGDGNTVTGVSSVTSEATGVYKATIPAQTLCDRLTVSWTATVATFARTVTDYVDVVSERLVPLWRLREDPELEPLSTEMIQRLADTVEEWIKNALKYPPVVESYRYQWIQEFPAQRLKVPGVHFPVALLALTYGRGTGASVFSPSDLAKLIVVENGFEYLDSGTFAPVDFLRGWDRGTFVRGAYSARVTHGGGGAFGLESPPEDLRRAAATLARYVARVSNLPERARRVVTENTEIDLSMPSADKPTGLPDVDGVIARYRIPAL